MGDALIALIAAHSSSKRWCHFPVFWGLGEVWDELSPCSSFLVPWPQRDIEWLMWLWFFSGIADTIAAWILSMLGVYLLIRGSWAVILFWCPSRSPVTIWGTSLRTTHCFHICSSSTPLWNWSTSFWPQISWRSIEQWLGTQDFQQIRGRAGAVSSERATSSSLSMLGFSHWLGFDHC